MSIRAKNVNVGLVRSSALAGPGIAPAGESVFLRTAVFNVGYFYGGFAKDVYFRIAYA